LSSQTICQYVVLPRALFGSECLDSLPKEGLVTTAARANEFEEKVCSWHRNWCRTSA
jgi:hypothetical protein